MNDGRLLIFGGTSDARLLCERRMHRGPLPALGRHRRRPSAGSRITGEIREGRMDAQAMAEYCRCHGIRLLADLSHPYAAVLSDTILQVQRELGIPLVRYNRPSDIDAVDNPLIYKTDSIDSACEIAMTLGQRVLLTTGSKQLADYIARLRAKPCSRGYCRHRRCWRSANLTG